MEDRIKQSYLSRLRRAYTRGTKKEKSSVLDKVQDYLGVGRRQARRIMETKKSGRPDNKVARGRPGVYQDLPFRKALRASWVQTNYMCAKRHKVALNEWLPYLVKDQPTIYTDDICQRLGRVSSGTIDRILKDFRASRGKGTTQAGGFREEIPIQGNIWNIQVPGHLEVDTVAHCGSSTEGQYISSLVMVDIATLWTEARAVFSKGSRGIVQGIEDIEKSLPFLLNSYDSDNGTEVLNTHVYNYFNKERKERGLPPVQMTRSRAYNKNDQAHVEQRNNSLARTWLGYQRLDFEELQPLITYYYTYVICPLINHFHPSFKLRSKVRKKSRSHRQYDTPATPYRRLMDSNHISNEQKAALQILHNQLDPLVLTRLAKNIGKQIKHALDLCKAGRGASRQLIVPAIPSYFVQYQNDITQARRNILLKEGIVVDTKMPLRKLSSS